MTTVSYVLDYLLVHDDFTIYSTDEFNIPSIFS